MKTTTKHVLTAAATAAIVSGAFLLNPVTKIKVVPSDSVPKERIAVVPSDSTPRIKSGVEIQFCATHVCSNHK